jgi:hypothetical protein
MKTIVLLAAFLAQEGKKIPVQGTDLMAQAEVTNATKVGQNYKIEKSGKMVISPLPEKMQSGSYQVKVYVLPLAAGATLDFRKLVDGKPMSWPLDLVDGKWRVKTGDGNEFTTPAVLNQWSEVIFDVIDETRVEKGVTLSKRMLRILVDGKPILPSGMHTGQLTDFTFQTNENGSVVIGGVHWIPPGKVKK